VIFNATFDTLHNFASVIYYHFVIYPLLFIGRYSLLQDRSLFASTSGFCDILSDMLFTGHGLTFRRETSRWLLLPHVL